MVLWKVEMDTGKRLLRAAGFIREVRSLNKPAVYGYLLELFSELNGGMGADCSELLRLDGRLISPSEFAASLESHIKNLLPTGTPVFDTFYKGHLRSMVGWGALDQVLWDKGSKEANPLSRGAASFSTFEPAPNSLAVRFTSAMKPRTRGESKRALELLKRSYKK